MNSAPANQVHAQVHVQVRAQIRAQIRALSLQNDSVYLAHALVCL